MTQVRPKWAFSSQLSSNVLLLKHWNTGVHHDHIHTVGWPLGPSLWGHNEITWTKYKGLNLLFFLRNLKLLALSFQGGTTVTGQQHLTNTFPSGLTHKNGKCQTFNEFKTKFSPRSLLSKYSAAWSSWAILMIRK